VCVGCLVCGRAVAAGDGQKFGATWQLLLAGFKFGVHVAARCVVRDWEL